MREVTIKGVRQGVLLVLPDDQAWETVVEQLESKLAAAASLIQGARAQVDVGDRPVSTEQLQKLVSFLSDTYQMESVALIANQPDAKAAAETIGLSLALPVPAVNPENTGTGQMPAPSSPSEVVANNALYLRQTVRSGQSIRHDGAVVICGDVNPGAEVVATGDILVFGTLRGVAHAGAAGDEGCQIIALNLRPTQIRIAGYIARSPDQGTPGVSRYPELACVRDAEIHIIPLRENP